MDTEDFNALVDRATKLLPKYGGFVSGAVNQASLLLDIRLTKMDFARVERAVAREAVMDAEADARMEGGE